MTRSRTAAREFVVAGLSILAAVVTGFDWIGEPLRWVHVITLVALGMAAGVALARARMRLRQDRKDKFDARAS